MDIESYLHYISKLGLLMLDGVTVIATDTARLSGGGNDLPSSGLFPRALSSPSWRFPEGSKRQKKTPQWGRAGAETAYEASFFQTDRKPRSTWLNISQTRRTRPADAPQSPIGFECVAILEYVLSLPSRSV